MNIEKFKKKNKNQYELLLDNGQKILLYEDVIIKNNLLVNKKIDSKLLEKINKDNGFESIYVKCVKKISTRLRSEEEIKNYLKENLYDEETINKVVDKLKTNKLINDDIFCKSYINDRLLLTNYGPNKIRNELKKHKINDEIINKHLGNIKKEEFENKIDKIINKYIKNNTKFSSIMLKNKIQNVLNDLGYYKEMYIDKLNNIDNKNDDDIFKKEAQKEYIKLSRKYKGKELEMKLKHKLYQKGFNLNKIDEFLCEIVE